MSLFKDYPARGGKVLQHYTPQTFIMATELPKTAVSHANDLLCAFQPAQLAGTTPIGYAPTNGLVRARTVRIPERVRSFAIYYEVNQHPEQLFESMQKRLARRTRAFSLNVPGGSIPVTAVFVNGVKAWSV